MPSTRTVLPLFAILDPRRLLRWIYIGRLSLASGIFVGAVLAWPVAEPTKTLLASLAFALTTVVTVASAGYSEVYRRPLGPTFLYLQSVFDLLLVTAVVQVMSGGTVGEASAFSALYILVIAAASLMLPAGGGLLIAALGNVMYIAISVGRARSVVDPTDPAVLGPLFLQLGIFAVVALGSAYLSAELRRRGEASTMLLAEHATVRLRAEEILRNIRSGVLTVDARERLVYANPTAAQLLGFDIETTLGRPALDLVHERSPALALALRRTVRDGLRTSRGEGKITIEGRTMAVGVTTTFIDAEDTGDRTATAIFQDISDQKRTEALRLRAERLEGVAELSASLAHEIRNPLASIRSAIEQLSRSPRTTDDERVLASLVIRESDRLSRLLSEFLDYARVRVAASRPVDLASVIRHATQLAGAHPERREGVRVVCAVPDDETLLVPGDEDLLHQAIFNLTLNAVQASPAGGEVAVEVLPDATRALPRGMLPDGPVLAVRVTDRGPGIPEADRQRMFDPFFTTKPQGSGLGLAVVHRAVEAHRGVVLVDTSPRGTRFTIVLPRVAAPLAIATA